MTPEQKRIALARACASIPFSVCSEAESCPICGACTYFFDTADETACYLYAEAVRRGAIKEDT